MSNIKVKKDLVCKDCGGFIKWELNTENNKEPIAIGISTVIVEFKGKCSGCGTMHDGIASAHIEVTGYHTTNLSSVLMKGITDLLNSEPRPTK